ncbi:MAG TPA: hypothetical protein VGN60_09085 [Devosia sp.]|jgi:hypothetical protein|nr:hypothetical protein [Devosia sp.]
MTLSEMDWNDSCCADSPKWAEVEVPSGWLRIKKRSAGYAVTKFGADKKLVAAETEISEADLQALL